ncbi:energy transducer TonB [Parasphingorhabdus sp.]|uniref:energy transducer TonB n=1 Tax=Parasphingorhabdus sp. TaxID=2709688 RepID=UPI00326433C0
MSRNFGTEENEILFAIVQGPKFGSSELILITPQIGIKGIYSKADLLLSNGTKLDRRHTRIYPGSQEGKSIWRVFNVNTSFMNNGKQGDILTIDSDKASTVALRVGDLSPPAKALEKCQRDLFQTMGMNYDQLASLKQFPKPKGNSGRWVMATDYPKAAYKERREGKTQFRLDVDQNGKVENCAILVSSGHADLDRETCRKAVSRARFSPALDENNQPTAAPWVSAARWQVPR